MTLDDLADAVRFSLVRGVDDDAIPDMGFHGGLLRRSTVVCLTACLPQGARSRPQGTAARAHPLRCPVVDGRDVVGDRRDQRKHDRAAE
jgi:hypothetical protein